MQATSYTFTVQRNRASVTQGTATVLLNGQPVIEFADSITYKKEVEGPEFGPALDNWQSTITDQHFIAAVLFPFKNNKTKIETQVRAIIGE